MKAFDGFLDKGSRDGGFDLLAVRPLSREVDTSMRFQIGERQRVTVASNYFAMACPIMPLGLLGAFMLLEKLGGMYEPDPDRLEALQTQRERGELTNALYIAAMKKKLETDKKLDGLLDGSGLQCSRPVDAILGLGDKRPGAKPPKKEVSLMLEGKRSEQINGPRLLNRAQRQPEVGKLVKAKMLLQSHLEEMAEEQSDYGAICRVSARLELLDKALKKLGC